MSTKWPFVVFPVCCSGRTVLEGVMRWLDAYMMGKRVTHTLGAVVLSLMQLSETVNNYWESSKRSKPEAILSTSVVSVFLENLACIKVKHKDCVFVKRRGEFLSSDNIEKVVCFYWCNSSAFEICDGCGNILSHTPLDVQCHYCPPARCQGCGRLRGCTRFSDAC